MTKSLILIEADDRISHSHTPPLKYMFGFSKRKQTGSKPSNPEMDIENDTRAEINLAEKLSKTRRGLSDGMADFFLGKKSLDAQMLEELENTLISADVGIEATSEIINTLQDSLTRKALANPEALRIAISGVMETLLTSCEQPLVINKQHKPFVLLVVGVNGAGKTTSIGKLAYFLKQQGHSVLLAAGDTFRAAAVEQLKEWGSRNDVPVVAQDMGADPASVIFDSIQSASSKNIDVVIADTAGRLHTQNNLMEELAKIKRVISKIDASAPHETLLVMDAGFGQNALQQAEQFHEILGLTGLAVTKLDGTAKGGILFAIASKLKLPIRFIGVGEDINDLRPFHAKEFVKALLK
jgi:fused signal recognition particle receptor